MRGIRRFAKGKTMPISGQVVDAINAQVGNELGAHLQYLAISSWFSNEGLRELSTFFANQAAEEHEHAMKFVGYIRDTGAPLVIPAIAAPKAEFATAEEAVALSLAWEEEVTRQINRIVDIAVDGHDHATQTFLQWFVTEQVEEVATMGELLQVVRRAGEPNLLLVEDYVARTHSAATSAR
jgi:bacterioferritin B